MSKDIFWVLTVILTRGSDSMAILNSECIQRASASNTIANLHKAAVPVTLGGVPHMQQGAGPVPVAGAGGVGRHLGDTQGVPGAQKGGSLGPHSPQGVSG